MLWTYKSGQHPYFFSVYLQLLFGTLPLWIFGPSEQKRQGEKKKHLKRQKKKTKKTKRIRISAFTFIFWNCPILYGEQASAYLYQFLSYRKIISIWQKPNEKLSNNVLLSSRSFHGGSFTLQFLPYPMYYTVQWITWKQNK